MREQVSIFPNCGLNEFSGLLEQYFSAQRWRVLSTTNHRSGELFPTLTHLLEAHPGSRAFVCNDPIPTNAFDPATLMHEFSSAPTAWDPLLIRALSQAAGGWTYSMLSDRHQVEFALAAFYAGRTLEAELHRHGRDQLGWCATDRALDEASTRSEFIRFHHWIARGHQQDLRWAEDAELRCWIALPPVDAIEDIDGLHAERLVRSIFVNTTSDQVRSALSSFASTEPESLHERASTIMQTPFVVVDGPLSEEGFTAMAKNLGCAAVHVEVLSGSGTFFWTEAATDGTMRSGKGHGALALATVLGAIAQLLDEPASAIR